MKIRIGRVVKMKEPITLDNVTIEILLNRRWWQIIKPGWTKIDTVLGPGWVRYKKRSPFQKTLIDIRKKISNETNFSLSAQSEGREMNQRSNDLSTTT